MEEKVKYHSRRSGIIFGVILMVAGALFLAFNLGFFEGGYKQVIFSWQMLVVVIGVIHYFYRHFITGTIFILIGAFFILPRLAIANPELFYWVTPDFTRDYWGILLIAAGILLILKLFFRPQKRHNHHHVISDDGRKNRNYQFNSTGKLDRNSVFSSVMEIVLDPEFQGGEVNAVFGNIILDLRKTALAEGETVLEVNAVFGGINVYIPENWEVELHLSNVFGGFDDKRQLSENVDRTRKLIIYGSCVFGGGEIRN